MNTTTYVVRHREHKKGARWRRIGTAATRAEALALVNCAGDFHISEAVNAERDDGPDHGERDPDGTGRDPG